MSEISNNKIIAKNTLLLYIRMAFAMAVALFTSRIVLNTLGVEDYGIYGIAGGFIHSLGFINSSLSSATSRFITVEIGKKGEKDLNSIFNNAFAVHLGISLLILIFAETIGLWFLTHKLNIPESRMYAAHWVYQLSVLSMIIGISQVPYNSEIIAHERIGIYAYAEMLNVIFKLLIVYVLLIYNSDKLILYSILNACISIGFALFYRFYCHKHFEECHINLRINKEILKRMLTFSGWDILGNLGVTARTHGISILINMFFGVIANAASSISGQIVSVVMAFASNILIAVKPQIIKSYAGENYNRTNQLLKYTFIGIFYLISLLAIPIIAEMRYIIHLWLGQIPPYTIGITTLSFIFSLISTFAMLMVTIPHAAGKNKYPSLVNGILYISALPVTYTLFVIKPIIWTPYIYNIMTIGLGLLFITWLTSKYLPNFNFKDFVIHYYLKNLIIVSVILCVVLFFQTRIGEPSFFRLICISIISTILILSSAYFLVLDRNDRKFIKEKACSYFKSHF